MEAAVSRNHRTPGIVRVVCTDPYHEGGEHYLRTMKLTDAGLVAIRGQGVKDIRHENGDLTYRFACICGRDPQRHWSDLSRIVLAMFAVNPGATRITLDITTL